MTIDEYKRLIAMLSSAEPRKNTNKHFEWQELMNDLLAGLYAGRAAEGYLPPGAIPDYVAERWGI